MPGLSIPGRLAKLEVSPDGGTTYENFGGIVDITMNLSVDELEVTSHDSQGSREYLPNFVDITLDVSGRWQDGDPGQEIVVQATWAKVLFAMRFYMEIAQGRKRWDGNGFSTSFSPSGPLDDAGSLDVSIRGSGMVMTNQPATGP